MDQSRRTRINQNKKRKNRTQKQQSSSILSSSGHKFLNCSPAVKGKAPIKGSCFTADVLQKLKVSYNKQYPNHLIHSTEPSEIWKELKQRMSLCTKEDCWLDVIESKEERKKLDKYLFAPDQPEEWKSKPNTWLSNYDIMEVLKQYETKYPNFKLIGPTPIDFDDRPDTMNGDCVWRELCDFHLKQYVEKGKTKIGIVFNLDNHKGPGSHWVSMFVDYDNRFIFYMDSAGEKIPPRIHKLVERIRKQGNDLLKPDKMTFHENYPMEHQYGNTECGMYCLYFLITMMTGETEGGSLHDHRARIRFFKKKRIPDKYIEKFRNVYFNS
jgi:hypothetical protein